MKKGQHISYHGHRFPAAFIQHCVWLYFRFPLSFRNIRDMAAVQGHDVSHETIRTWCHRFGQQFARVIRAKSAPGGDQWHLDEVHVRIQGATMYVWRGVDQDGQVLDILVQRKRDGAAAARFIRRLNNLASQQPRRIVTDKLRAYRQACADLLPDAQHITDKAQNNRAENSHQPTRIRERQMKRFKSMAHAQRFLTIFSAIGNLFDIGAHLLTAESRQYLQAQRWREWPEITQGGGT